MKKIKKAVAALVVLATISALSICASAYSNPDFIFDFVTTRQTIWTLRVSKEDTLNTAKVHVRGGTVSDTKPLYTTLYTREILSNAYRATTTAILRSSNTDGTMTYTGSYAKGEFYQLCGETGPYMISANGYWNP